MKRIMPAARIRVLIADDHPLVVDTLCEILSFEPDIEVIDAVRDRAAAVAGALNLKPDVLLIGVSMPRGGTLETVVEIKTILPAVKVLVLNISEWGEELWQALRLGAQGFLPVSASIDEIGDYIRRAAAGKAVLSTYMAAKLMGEFRQEIKGSSQLSDTEKIILRLLAEGKERDEVARLLSLTAEIVDICLARFLDALQLMNRAKARAYAQNNLIEQVRSGTRPLTG